MKPGVVEGANKTFGKPSDWKEQDCGSIQAFEGVQGLPSGGYAPLIVVKWDPSPADIQRLQEGAGIYLWMNCDFLVPHSISTTPPAITYIPNPQQQ